MGKKTLTEICYAHINEMAEQVKMFVKEHQGEKGYIDLRKDDDYKNNHSLPQYDEIVTIAYIGEYETPEDVVVKAVRYDKEYDVLEILYDNRCCGSVVVVWSEDDIKKADEDDWEIVNESQVLDYTKTIFELAEFLEEYVEE
jgi:hypothetical protein